VLYAHGRGMDMPVALTRIGWVADSAAKIPEYQAPLGPVFVSLRRNWQQSSDGGNLEAWQYTSTGDIQTLGDQQLAGSAGIPWPGPDISPYRVKTQEHANASWWGSMMDNHHDASGLLYMRNRFYDPQTGRFTQEDPIGLAGGLNAYGFAAGDPISFGDPYGLCPPKDTNVSDCANDKLGNAWRALAGAGPAGEATIEAIVDRQVEVRLGNTKKECGSTRGCTSSDRHVITIRSSMRSGAIAVALAHEGGGHLTESAPTTVEGQAQNEWRAWDIQTSVYNGLTGTRRKEAEHWFKKEEQIFTTDPKAALDQFRAQAQKDCPGCP
jgi:RHS repeat-associated protein